MTKKKKLKASPAQNQVAEPPKDGAIIQPLPQQIEMWPIERLIPYVRNPRKNDAAVDRMCASIREFGFKIPCLVRGDGEVVDGHLRLKAAHKLEIAEIPVIRCDEWTPAQVKAFRLLVNRSVTWADWDEELLALELKEIQEADFDLSLTGFDPGQIDDLVAMENDEVADAAPPSPESPVSQPGDLWLLGPHRVLCGDATSAEVVARLLEERQPRLIVAAAAPTPRRGAHSVPAEEFLPTRFLLMRLTLRPRTRRSLAAIRRIAMLPLRPNAHRHRLNDADSPRSRPVANHAQFLTPPHHASPRSSQSRRHPKTRLQNT